MRLNPLEVEQLFSDTVYTVKQAGSERVQLFVIYEFAKKLANESDLYESYLVQITELLPELKNPLLFTGIRPEQINDVIHVFEKITEAVPELLQHDDVQHKLALLRDGAAIINTWMNFDEQELSQTRAVSRQISQPAPMKGEALIPVIEGGEQQAAGRLRKMQVDVLGKSREKMFELKPTFGVIGAETGSLGVIPAKAAGKLLQQHRSGGNSWKGSARFEQSHAWHAGRSANLALAALFYCEMLKAEKSREHFDINPAIVITGDLDEEGNVLAVEESTLKNKAEAAFFSWAQALVVPAAQLNEVLGYLEQLEEEYPQRSLTVAGVAHLKEIFYDRRLTLYQKKTALEHHASQLWNKKFSVAGAAVFLVMALTLAKVIYGPIDKNPAAIEYDGASLIVQNKTGTVLFTKEVGDLMVLGVKTIPESRIRYTALIDVDGDGTNEVVWTSYKSKFGRTEIVLGNAAGDTLWVKNFTRNVEYPYHPYIQSDIFVVRSLYTADLDGNGLEEILIVNNHEQYFPCFVSVIDPKTGKVTREMLHQGVIESLLIEDLDSDGIKEIVYGGVNNTHKLGFLAAVSYPELRGQSGASKRYSLPGWDSTKNKLYMLFPQSIVGKKLSNNSGINTRIESIHLNRSNKIYVRINELVDGGTNMDFDLVQLQYLFDLNLKPVAIGSIDSYDLAARELYETGRLPFLADGLYLQAFKDSLLWWNGEQFVQEYTLLE